MFFTVRNVAWSVGQVVVTICAFLLFLVWAPWEGAKPISEASPSIVASLPPGCPAFTVNHGHYLCFEFGTQAQNPLGYWTCTILFVVALAFLFLTGLTGRGLYALLRGRSAARP